MVRKTLALIPQKDTSSLRKRPYINWFLFSSKNAPAEFSATRSSSVLLPVSGAVTSTLLSLSLTLAHSLTSAANMADELDVVDIEGDECDERVGYEIIPSSPLFGKYCVLVF